MSKQPKTTTPTDADLKGNPMIGGSKGVTTDDLEAIAGDSTFEGDTDNDTNAQGGIDKATARGGRAPDGSDTPRTRKA